VDVRARVIPVLGEDARVERTWPVRPLRLVQEASAENAVIAVMVTQEDVTFSPARREVHGRRTQIPWRWHAPLVKPVVAALVVPPLVMSLLNSHTHGDLEWTTFDYLKDVVSWYNFVSAVPVGPANMADEVTLIASEPIETPQESDPIPVGGHSVIFRLAGKTIAVAESDEEGIARADIGPSLSPELAGDDCALTAYCRTDDGRWHELSVTVPKDVLQKLLERQ
jgi:hypothetical protein